MVERERQTANGGGLEVSLHSPCAASDVGGDGLSPERSAGSPPHGAAPAEPVLWACAADPGEPQGHWGCGGQSGACKPTHGAPATVRVALCVTVEHLHHPQLRAAGSGCPSFLMKKGLPLFGAR